MILKKITITGIILGVGIANQLLATSDDSDENFPSLVDFFIHPTINSQGDLKNILDELYRDAKRVKGDFKEVNATYDSIPVKISVRKPKGLHKASEVWMTAQIKPVKTNKLVKIDVSDIKKFSDEKLYERSFKKLKEIAENAKTQKKAAQKELMNLCAKNKELTEEKLKKLISKGADINAVSNLGMQGCKTPLTAAIGNYATDNVKLLLKFNADIKKSDEQKGGYGNTPIGTAVFTQNPNPDMVKILIEHDPEIVSQPDSNGQTPLDIILSNSLMLSQDANRKVLSLLLKNNAQTAKISHTNDCMSAVVNLLTEVIKNDTKNAKECKDIFRGLLERNLVGEEKKNSVLNLLKNN